MVFVVLELFLFVAVIEGNICMHYPENETSYEIAQNDNVKYAIINKENLAVECKIYETATISEIQINTKNYFLIDKSKYSLEYKKFQKKSIQK